MENPKKITTIGGQALMEGIMMVGPKRTVAAFCDEEGNISTEEISVPRLTKQYPLLGKPFIRGIFALADSFRMGYKALSLSADKLTEGDEEEELSGLDKWLNDHLGEKITGVIMAAASVLGIALAVVLFFMLPTIPVSYTHLDVYKRQIEHSPGGGAHLTEGLAHAAVLGALPSEHKGYLTHLPAPFSTSSASWNISWMISAAGCSL